MAGDGKEKTEALSAIIGAMGYKWRPFDKNPRWRGQGYQGGDQQAVQPFGQAEQPFGQGTP